MSPAHTDPVRELDLTVRQALASGQAVALRLEGDLSAVPRPALRAAAAIVRVLLGHALSYAGGARVDLELRAAAGALRLRVANAVPRAFPTRIRTGLGLLELKDLAAGAGGTLSTDTSGPRWVVRVVLPYQEPTTGPALRAEPRAEPRTEPRAEPRREPRVGERPPAPSPHPATRPGPARPRPAARTRRSAA